MPKTIFNVQNKKTTTTQWNKDKTWVLSDQQMYEDNVYVHSTVRNFYKNMRVSGFFIDAMSNLQLIALETSAKLDNIMQHVKPDASLRTPNFFNMFQSSYREKMLNNLKNSILLALKNDIYKNAQQMASMQKERIRSGNKKSAGKKEYLNITSTGTINYILDEKKAIHNIKTYFLNAVAATENSAHASEIIMEAVGETLADTDLVTIGDAVSVSQGMYDTIMINGQNVSLNKAFQVIQDIVQSFGKYVPQDGEDKQKYYSILKVGNFFEFLSYKSYTGSGKKGNYWSDLGSVFEIIISAGIQELGEAVNLIGSNRELQKYNTSDIELLTKKVVSAVDGSFHNLGVSIKHTINFNKEKAINTKNYDKLYNIMGVNEQQGERILKQYKYFILNYSLLGNMESSGMKNAGLRALDYTNTLQNNQLKENERAAKKGVQPKTLTKADVARADDNLRSHAEITTLYEEYSNLLGRIFLTMSLIGDITQKMDGYTSKEGIATAIPMILVDQDYAIFTYDVLNNLKTLLGTGDVTLDINTSNMLGTFSALHTSKLKAIFKSNTIINDYATLIADVDVNKNIDILNRSAFQTRSKNEDGTITVANVLKINSMIDMASTIERLRSSGIYAGASRA